MPRTLKGEAMPLMQNPPALGAPTSIEEAKALGPVTAGQLVVAPLTPINGPIDGKPGDFVAGVLKGFWESPTIKALRNAVATAVGLGIGVVTTQIIVAQGNLWDVNWQVTQKAAIAVVAFSLATAYAAWWKKHDNDPVQ